MKPTWQTTDGAVRLYLGDALRILPEIEAVDCVLTDPPFGVRDEDWDSMDAYEFARFSMAWLSQSRRISDTLVSFYASGTEFSKWCEFLFPRVRQLVWHKPLGSQYAGSSESKLWFAFEPIAHCFTKERWEVVKPKALTVANIIKTAREKKGLSRGGVDMVIRGKKTGLCYRWEEAACLPTPAQAESLKSLLGMNGEFQKALDDATADKDDTLQKMAEKAAEKAAEKTDVFSYRTVTNGCHPCEKPLELLLDLIGTLTEFGETICDPFMGSGTAGVAATRIDRRFIGIESDAGHFETAKNRIEAELSRAPLFAPPPQIQRSLIA